MDRRTDNTEGVWLMSWTGELNEKSALAVQLRSMSEPHDFEIQDFQSGAFATGAEYVAALEGKTEWYNNLKDTGWTGELEETG